MARFDVHRAGDDYIIDCQAELLNHLNTRLVVPLLDPADAPKVASRLNPTFDVGGRALVMYTQFATSLPCDQLSAPVLSLAGEQFAILDALDMLISGY